MSGTAARAAAVAPAARCPRPPRARATSEPALTRRRADVSTRSFGDDGEVVIHTSPLAFPTGAGNPPVTGGPIIRPRGRPSRFGSPDADERGASTGDSSVTRDADASIARRTSSWNRWFLDAVAARNVAAVDLLLDMPWASTASVVSAMRAMHDPFVFERVCERLATRRAHELETKERVGGLTALGFAAKKGNAKALARLLDAGAEADAADNAGATALMHAVVGDSLVAVRVLTERGACADGRASVSPSDDRDDLATVDPSRARETTSTPLTPRVKKKKGGWTPLTWASRKGQANIVAVLLEANADPNVTGGGSGSQTPLIHAAMGGHVAVVDMLAKAGADPRVRDDAQFDATMHAAFRHPQNAALLAAVARAANGFATRASRRDDVEQGGDRR